MSFFPVSRYQTVNDPADRFFGDQLNFFDPWRDFETFSASMLPNSFRWINEPRSFPQNETASSNFHSAPVSSEKFRVQMKVDGFHPETIRTRVEGRRVIVEAKQEDRQANGDFSLREIRKSYDLPEHAGLFYSNSNDFLSQFLVFFFVDTNNLASFVTPNNMLVIEVPLKKLNENIIQHQEPNFLRTFGNSRDPVFDYHGFMSSSDFRPRIVETQIHGQKQIRMSLPVKNYRPEQIKVSIKNNELRVQAESFYNENNRSERSFLTKSISLPPGTQIEQLKSYLTADGHLEIEAPFIESNQQRQIEFQHL